MNLHWDEVLKLVNSGKDCTGFCNTGNRNTGDWNESNFNTGCFMTDEPTIMMFNKPSDWTYGRWMDSDARYLLSKISKDVVEWVCESDMTDEEKANNPTYTTTGGYLKVLDESECAQVWWNGLSDYEKRTIESLPNYDAKIFAKITGIKVDDEN